LGFAPSLSKKSTILRCPYYDASHIGVVSVSSSNVLTSAPSLIAYLTNCKSPFVDAFNRTSSGDSIYYKKIFYFIF
jgi:hypothetical protein